MRLHVHTWGDPEAPPVVCLHGVSAHGERFKRLAEKRWAAKFRVVAPDLRGHGRSGYEPPWTIATHVADVVETLDALELETARRRRPLVRRPADPRARGRAPGTPAPRGSARPGDPDPAAHRGGRRRTGAPEPVYDSPEDYADRRTDSPSRELVLEDALLACEQLPDGRLRRRTSQPAVISIYGELASDPPPPDTLRAPTL